MWWKNIYIGVINLHQYNIIKFNNVLTDILRIYYESLSQIDHSCQNFHKHKIN